MPDPFAGFDFAFEAIDLGLPTAGKFEAHKPGGADLHFNRFERHFGLDLRHDALCDKGVSATSHPPYIDPMNPR
jgi:hypothetical protein